jgi:hypothetical protein
MMIDAASKMFPSQAPALSGISQQLKDENIPLNERAAMASQVGDLINMSVGEGRHQQEMGMKSREMDWREQGAVQDSRINELRVAEAEMDIDRRKQDDAIMDEVGAARFERALKLSDSIPEKDRPFTAEYLKKAKTLDPRAQFKLAELIEQALPAPVKRELKTIPATINGQPGEMTVWADEQNQTIAPVQMDGMVLPPIRGGASDEPPSMMQTTEGPELPAGEAKKIGQTQAQDGTPLDVVVWNNAVYHVPSSGPRVTPGRITPQPGQLTQKDQYEIAKDQAAQAKVTQAAAVEAQGFVSALDELEKHPGFSNLFGSNVGVPTWYPGSSGADAKAVLGKVQGKAFLEAIEKLRGMGALSEKEGETATKAYSALTPSMSEDAAKKEIATLKKILQTGTVKAAAMGTAAGGTMPTVEPRTSDTERLRAKLGN